LYAHFTTATGWHVRAGIPPNEMMQEFRNDLFISASATIISLLLALIFTTVLSRKIVLPVHQLLTSTEEITKENTFVKVPETGPTELRSFAVQFNLMVEALTKTKQSVTEHLEKLQESNHELDAFSYSVSHDLRTPLRAIDGFSRMVLKRYDDKLDDEGKRLLHVIRDNTAKMAQLIDDILAFSRAGRLELNRSEVDLDELVQAVWQDLSAPLTDRSIQFEMQPLGKVSGDAAMLHQVIENLLNNAIKFTRPVATAVITVGSNETENEKIFFVRDNGVGFDQTYVHKLFGVFQRLHGTDEFEGTGIGLAIVKRIVTKHEGRIWAEGVVNQGATVYFTLAHAKEKQNV